MTTIPLIAGYNYISFPETSSSNFGTLLTEIRTVDATLTLQRYSSIIGDFLPVNDDFEFIEKGTGYLLTIKSPTNLTYVGTPYTLTFDQLKSKILKGWNLIGTGSNIITIPNWCTITDPSADITVTKLEPTKSYWIYYDECVKSMISVESALSIIASALFIYYLLGEFKIIGKHR